MGFPQLALVVAFVTPEALSQIGTDEQAKAAYRALRTTELMLPPALADKPVPATFCATAVQASDEAPPLVLLHGFDSSCLEFRRLMPELEQRGVEAYALDILGWGFADTNSVRSVGVEAKREALRAFWQDELNGRKMALSGVSLGAAVIIDFFNAYPEAVASVALVDPQGFIDGAPPVPAPLARGGIKVLGSWPLRSLANQLAYYNKEAYATDDAIRIGLLHTSRPGWEDDSVEWLLGGGYSVSGLVPKLASLPCLIMWGRQDEILPPSDFAPRFIEALPNATFRWVEECGHSPHLEQPVVLARALASFLQGDAIPGDSDCSQLIAASQASPLDRLNALLDTPILDTNERGGALEPFKAFARSEPELAQVAASIGALSFFVVVGRLLVALSAAL